jgi:hypothetical protein
VDERSLDGVKLEERVRELQRAGDSESAVQLIRAAISCAERAEFRFDGERVRVTHPAYTGSHDVWKTPFGEVRVRARGEYLFTGESDAVRVDLTAVNSRAVQVGRDRVRPGDVADPEAARTAGAGESARGDAA